MSKIIALVDGSIYSESVCEYASWISSRTSSSVDILHVLARHTASARSQNLSGNIALGARTTLLEELSETDALAAKKGQVRGREILNTAQSQLQELGVGQVQTLLRIGDIVEEVKEFEAEAQMVVIGKRGDSADFVKLNLGANLESIVRSCQKPVFLAARSFIKAERFLVAFDGGPSSQKAIDYIANSSLFSGLRCHLLHVGGESPKTEHSLMLAKHKIERSGLDVTTDVINGSAEAVIGNAVKAKDIGLLVMGAYGHSRIRNIIIGSTTTEMIHRCKIPIMLFR